MDVSPLAPLATNAALSELLSALGAIGIGQIENGQGQEDMAAHRFGGLLGEAPDEPQPCLSSRNKVFSIKLRKPYKSSTVRASVTGRLVRKTLAWSGA